jgi:uncharacterized OB-fold protein
VAKNPDPVLSAPYTTEFGFERTTGPVVGAFLGGLRDGVLYGVRTNRGTILCPAAEFDPETAEETTGELVELAAEGTVQTWTWVPRREIDQLASDFAWALIAIDGTGNTLFHAVDTTGDLDSMHTGMRVRARWRGDRTGSIGDIECFEPVP